LGLLGQAAIDAGYGDYINTIAQPGDDYRILYIHLADDTGDPVLGLEDGGANSGQIHLACGALSPTADKCTAAGFSFGSIDAVGGTPGSYQVKVYSTLAGRQLISVTVDSMAGGPLPDKNALSNDYVTATFSPMSIAFAGTSSLTINCDGSEVANYISDAVPGDYCVGTIVLKDINGSGIPGVSSLLSLATQDAGDANKVYFRELTEDTSIDGLGNPTAPGRYTFIIHADVAGSYPIQFTYTPASGPALTENGDQPAVFAQPAVDLTRSSHVLDNTADHIANNADFYSGTITLLSANGAPVRDGVAKLTLAVDPTSGSTVSAITCVMSASKCTGVYNYTIQAAKVGTYTITPTYDATGANLSLPARDATFIVTPAQADPDSSVFVLGSSTTLEVPSGQEVDVTVATPAQAATQLASVDEFPGYSFHINVKVWDTGQVNPVPGVNVKAALSGAGCDASTMFDGSGAASAESVSLADGTAQFTVTAQAASTCTVSVTIEVGVDVAVAGSVKTLTWVDAPVDFGNSYYTVAPAAPANAIKADDIETGTITVTLRDANNLPVGNQVLNLNATPETGSRITIDLPFTHIGNGVYTATWHGKKAGAFDMFADVSGTALSVQSPAGNGKAYLKPGDPSIDGPFDCDVNDPKTAQGTNLSASPTLLPVDQWSTIKALVTDKFCNPVIEPVVVTFATDNGVLSAATNSTDATGVATVSLTDSVARTDTVSAMALGLPILNVVTRATGVEVEFTATNADPASSLLEAVTTGDKVVGGVEKHIAQVTVKDGSGGHNLLPGRAVTFTYRYTDLDGTVRTGTYTTDTQANGIATFEFGSNVATVWTITASIIEGQVPPVAGLDFNFVAGPADVNRTLASFEVGKETVRADGIAQVPAQMKVQDAFGNAVSGETCGFFVTYTGDEGAKFPGNIKDIDPLGPTGDDGICSTYLTSYYPGAFPVSGRFDSTDTPDSQNATFSNQAIDKDKSFWDVTPTAGNSKTPAVADGVDSYTVTIHLRDAANTPLNKESVTISYKLTPDGPEQTFVVTSVAPDGIATGFIQTTVAGLYDVQVLQGGDPIATTAGGSTFSLPVTFQAGNPDPAMTATTWVYSTGRVESDGVATHYGTLTVLDAFGNKVENALVTFDLSTDKGAVFTSTSNSGDDLGQSLPRLSDPDGVITVYVAYNSPTPQVTQINATLDTIGVGTAPFLFGPDAPDAAHSTFVVTPAAPGTATADGVDSFEGVVTVRDSNGVLVGGYTVNFEVPANVTVVETGPFVTDPITGEVTIHFVSTVAGDYTVNALVGAAKVPTVDRVITFIAGPIDLDVSTFDVTTGKVYADGEASHTGTAVIMDANGNPISGVTVTFGIDTGSANVAGPVLESATDGPAASVTAVTGADGVASISIKSNEPGTFAATATVPQGTIAGYANLLERNRYAQFTAGDPDPILSTRAVSPDTDTDATISVASDGAESFAITVSVRSAKDILVDRADVRIVGLNSVVTLDHGDGVTGKPIPTSADEPPYGTFTWHATSLTSGSYTAQVQVKVNDQWQDVGALVKLNFAPGDGYPANSWLVEPTTTAVADNNATLPVSAYVFDINGNAVTTGTVTFTIPTGTSVGNVTGLDTVPAAISNGVATINVKSTVAATHEITAELAAGQIMNVKQAPGSGDPVVATDGLAHVTFTYGTADPASSLLSVPTAANGATVLANGADEHVAQVVVRDANSNLVLAGTVTFYYRYVDFANVEHTGNSGPRPIDSATGIATWPFSSTVAKPWTITAVIGGTASNVNPVDGVVAGFHAGPPDPDRTVASLEVGKDTAKADGQASVPAWMIVQDAFGNPVANQYCGFKLTDTRNPGAAKFDNANTGAFEKTNVGPTGDDGKCAVEIKSVYAGHFPVRGVFDQAETADPLPEALFNNQAVNAAQSWWSVAPEAGNSTSPDATANDSDAYTVTVNLRDAAGGLVNNESVDVYYQLTSSSTPQILTVVSGANGNPAGTATASIHTTTAGVYNVFVKKGSDSIATSVGGSTFVEQVTFIAGAPDGIQSFLTSPVGTAKANGTTVQMITATVKDVHGNVIPNQAVTFTIPQGVTSGAISGSNPVPATTDTNGVAYLPLTSVKPGTYEVTAMAGTVPIETNSPASATFVNDDLSLSNSLLVLTTSGAMTVGTGFHTVQATLVDAQGNVFTPVREVTFYAKAPGASSWQLLGTANTLNGVAPYTFTKTKAGTWQVRAEVTSDSPTGKIGTGTDGTIVYPEFKAGAADAAKTATMWTGSTGRVLSNDTDTHYAQVIVVDQYENPVEDAEITFTLSANRAAHFVNGNNDDLGKSVSPTSDPDGVITVLLASGADEVTDITATLNGVSVVASAGPDSFEFGPDAPSAANSTFVVTPAAGSTKIADGVDSFEGVVTVRDGNGLPVDEYIVNFAIPGDVHIVETDPDAFKTDVNGQITVHFTSTKADTYTVNALVGSLKVPTVDRQIEFVAGAIDFNKSYLEVDASGAIANGTDTDEVSVHLFDHYDNPVLDGYVNFILPGAVSPVGSAAEVGPSSTGEVSLQLTSTIADEYPISAEVRRGLSGAFLPITTVESARALVAGTSVPVTFVAGQPVASASILTVNEIGPKVADGVDYYTVNIELKDVFGNTVKTAGNSVHFTFELNGSVPQVVDMDALTAANGIATYQFATSTAGTWSVAGLYGGQPVSNSPQSLLFVAGAFSASVSTFDVTGGKVQSDGIAEHSGRAVVTDAFGNPISGVDVTFTIAAGAAGVPGPYLSDTAGTPGTQTTITVTSLAGGVAEVFITSEEPGTFPVTAEVNGAAITGYANPANNRDAQFTSGDPDPAHSSRSVSPDTDADPTIEIKADNTETYAITATIRSAFDARVENAAVRLVLPDDSPVTLIEGSGSDGSLITGMPGSVDPNRLYGQFVWHAKTTKAGSYTAQVQVQVGTDWFDVGAPVTLNFKAGDPSVGPFTCDAGQTGTSFNFSPTHLEIGELSTGTVKVTDQFCNPVPNAIVTFNTTNGTFQPGTGTATTGPNGMATITLTDDTERIDTVSATVAGLQIAVTGTEMDVTPVTTQPVEFFDGTVVPPNAPVVDPSNGGEVTGESDPGTTITVTDPDGNPIEGCVDVAVGADGKFSCTPTEKIPGGTEISVTATDPQGNESPAVKITIGQIAMTLDPPALYRGDMLKLHGLNFIPGEGVTVVASSNPVTIGTFVADANGDVTIPDWKIPDDFEYGPHTATLTGAKSGPISMPFTVLERIIASTGGSASGAGSTSGSAPIPVPAPMALTAIAAILPKRKLG
jgi:adhesin/invasin